jgi:hypothetical protein
LFRNARLTPLLDVLSLSLLPRSSQPSPGVQREGLLGMSADEPFDRPRGGGTACRDDVGRSRTPSLLLRQSLRAPLTSRASGRAGWTTTASLLQARQLSLGWPFKKTEPDLILPRAPADIEPSPLAGPSASLPVDPNPLPSSPLSEAGTPTAPEPILASSSSPNLPQPPRASSIPLDSPAAQGLAAPAESASEQAAATFDMGSVVDPATGILANGVDLRYLPEHFGDLKAQGLCSWWPTGWVQWIMEAIHVSTGLPWCVLG